MPASEKSGNEKRRRPFVGVHFRCCNVYNRVYLNAEGTKFDGACPRCGSRVQLRASSSGSTSRFWEAE